MSDPIVATHIRLKTGDKVYVTRMYQTVIVKTLAGKVLGSYEQTDMAKFHKRYQKIDKRKKSGAN